MTQSLCNGKPALAMFYSSATDRIYGCVPYVNAKLWAQFRVFEDDLRELSIPSRDYAYSVLTVLKDWTVYRHFKYVPVNTFTGKWALGKFLKIWNSESIELPKQENPNDKIMQAELMIARLYIAENIKGYTRLSKLVEDCRSVICDEWYELYINKNSKRNKFVYMAIDIVKAEYNLYSLDADSYQDIIQALL